MGSSASYWADRDDEVVRAYDKVGLRNDRVYGVGASHREEDLVIACASRGESKEETIKAIIKHRKDQEADAQYRAEMEERKLLKKLLEKYGAP